MKRQELKWCEMKWQRPFDLENVWSMLTYLAASSPRGLVCWEVRACGGSVRYLLGTEVGHQRKVKNVIASQITASFVPADKVMGRKHVQVAKQLRVSKSLLSLNDEITMAVVRSALAAMVNGDPEEEVVLQVVLGAAHAPQPAHPNPVNPHNTWLDIALGNAKQASHDTKSSIKKKAEQHCFDAVVRIGSTAEHSAKVSGVISALRTLASAGVNVSYKNEQPLRLDMATMPWHFPLRLSVKELANFLLLPAGEEEFQGVAGLHPKLIPAPSWYKPARSDRMLRAFAESTAGTPTTLTISPKDSLEHTIILGPTGSGKSTAMEHLIMADINAGRSVLVLDPKADLVTDILERIPENRRQDVVVIDPSDPCPVGFNPLALRKDQKKDLIADAILSVMQEIFADSWGVRSHDIINAALLTLIENEDATLVWLPTLLTDDEFRAKLTRNLKDDISLIPFWEQYESKSNAARNTEIAPVLNKMRQFLLRPGLRNVLGQAHPKFDFMDLFYKRKIVLVPLNKGLIGGESARLLGSLIVGLTWTMALSRARLPKDQRHLVSIYIDELQDYLSLPTNLSDALAQARGLGLGITMAHQYRGQLPAGIKDGIDANARNKIIFGLNGVDAREVAKQSVELEPEDFMMLPRYHIYTNHLANGKNTGWISGVTIKPTPALRMAAELKAESMKRYGRPAAEIEAEIRRALLPTPVTTAQPAPETSESFPSTTSSTNIGRKKL